MNNKVTVLGAGAFGTSIATVLAENGYRVYLWCYESELVDFINIEHENKLYFSNFKLNENIFATNSLKEALEYSNFIFQAIPVKFLRHILLQARGLVSKNQKFISLSKGIENNSLLFPSQIINEIFDNQIVVLSGPSFALEIVQKKYTTTVIASTDNQNLLDIKDILENDYFKLELSNDTVGVQAGAALKNLISILVGIFDGYNIGQNAIAMLVTKGLEEISKIVEFFGGSKDAVYGLSGLGDLILSTNTDLGRNFKLGKNIGTLKLKNLFNYEDFFKNKILPEGVNTVKSIHQLIKRQDLNLPLCEGTYQLIFEELSVENFLKKL